MGSYKVPPGLIAITKFFSTWCIRITSGSLLDVCNVLPYITCKITPKAYLETCGEAHICCKPHWHKETQRPNVHVPLGVCHMPLWITQNIKDDFPCSLLLNLLVHLCCLGLEVGMHRVSESTELLPSRLEEETHPIWEHIAR